MWLVFFEKLWLEKNQISASIIKKNVHVGKVVFIYIFIWHTRRYDTYIDVFFWLSRVWMWLSISNFLLIFRTFSRSVQKLCGDTPAGPKRGAKANAPHSGLYSALLARRVPSRNFQTIGKKVQNICKKFEISAKSMLWARKTSLSIQQQGFCWENSTGLFSMRFFVFFKISRVRENLKIVLWLQGLLLGLLQLESLINHPKNRNSYKFWPFEG